MKKISIYLFLIALAFPAIVNAEESLFKAGTKSIAFSINENIQIRGSYFLNPNWSWLLGVGYSHYKVENNGNWDSENDFYMLSTGARHYFSKKEVNFFAEGLISYLESDSDNKLAGVVLNIGVEYFIAKPLSLSGTIGVNYSKNIGSESFKAQNYGTLQNALQVNFYF